MNKYYQFHHLTGKQYTEYYGEVAYPPMISHLLNVTQPIDRIKTCMWLSLKTSGFI